MPTSASTLKLYRQVHLYIGIFITPAILFFALTGALQTFSLHETTQGSSYKPPRWVATLAQLHKKQTATVAAKKARPPEGAPEGKTKDSKRTDAAAPAAQQPAVQPGATRTPVTAPSVPTAPPPVQKSHLPMKIFFLLVSLGLFSSTLTGLYMAYKFNRNKLVVTGLLVAGVVVPLLLLPF